MQPPAGDGKFRDPHLPGQGDLAGPAAAAEIVQATAIDQPLLFRQALRQQPGGERPQQDRSAAGIPADDVEGIEPLRHRPLPEDLAGDQK